MTDSSKIQLPTISKTLTDAEIRLHLLTLAADHSHHNALGEAKKWYEWVIEKQDKDSKASW